MSRRTAPLSADLLLRAYSLGLFPMADSRGSDRRYWLDPEQRGILPLDRFHLSRRLFRTVRSGVFEVSVDRDFPATIAGCASSAPGRLGYLDQPADRASVQASCTAWAMPTPSSAGVTACWSVGCTGVALGGAFFGESMFSFATDASKVALAHLIARLRLGGFRLLDTQFVTTHLAQFGVEEIPRDRYKILLTTALDVDAVWLTDIDPAVLDAEFRLLAGKESG